MKSLKSVLEGINYELVSGNLETEINRIDYDSREIGAGDMFIALRGRNTDGHNYLEEVIGKGASVVVVEEIPAGISSGDTTIVMVPDTREAMAYIADNFYEHPSREFKLIAVTGTNGKTSVCHITADILGAMGVKTGVIGTNGLRIGSDRLNVRKSTITTPESLDLQEAFREMARAGVEIVIMEATSMALKQKRLLGSAISVGVFTNISPEHLDDHGTFEDYLSSKMMLFQMTDKAVSNADEETTEQIRALVPNILTFGASESAELRIENLKPEATRTSFDLIHGGKVYNLAVPLPGIFNVFNTITGIGALLQIGYELDEIIKNLDAITSVPGRMEKVENDKGINVIVDFAHTPGAMEPLLQFLASVKKKKLITVFGCGGNRDPNKRPIMGKLSAEYSDIVIVTSDNSRMEETDDIIEEILAGIPPELIYKVKIEGDREKAIALAISLAEPEDIVILAGRGNETHQLLKGEKIPFIDAEVAKKYLDNK